MPSTSIPTRWHRSGSATGTRPRPCSRLPRKLEFLRKAKDAGFFIRLFYVCTSDPTINVARIAQRYMNGGHEVPISKIITRYYKSLANATKAITFVDRAYIYDNSVDNQLPRLLYRTTDGKPFKRYTDDIPLWAQTIID